MADLKITQLTIQPTLITGAIFPMVNEPAGVPVTEKVTIDEILNYVQTNGSFVSTLQEAYDNSTSPEITTDATLGALSIKRGSAADTDDVVEVLNGVAVQTFYITGEGVVGVSILESVGNTDLVLRTGNAITGIITITDGANGDITMTPNGTGELLVNGDINPNGFFSNHITPSIDNSYFLGSSTKGWGALEIAAGGYIAWDGEAGAFLYADSVTGAIRIASNGTEPSTLESWGSTPLTLKTGGVAAGVITINSGTNGGITLAPDGSGLVSIINGGTSTQSRLYIESGLGYIDQYVRSNGQNVIYQYAWDGAAAETWVEEGLCYYNIGDSTGNIFLSPSSQSAQFASYTPGALGYVMELAHFSASPAQGDVVGRLNFRGRNSIAGNTDYAQIDARIQSPTSGAEESYLDFNVLKNGVITTLLSISGDASFPEVSIVDANLRMTSGRFIQDSAAISFLTLNGADAYGVYSGSFMFDDLGAMSAASGTEYGARFYHETNQSGTASYVGIGLDVLEGGVGSGTKLLMELQSDGVTKFQVDTAGVAESNGKVLDIVPEQTSVTTSATPTPVGSGVRNEYYLTALAEAGTTTFAVPSGSPSNGNSLLIRIKDNGTSRVLAWNAIYREIGITLPAATTISKTMYIGCKYNSADSKWDVIAVTEEV